MLFFAIPLSQSGPWAALWTTPCILLASLLITWGAEAAQFFVAQGFALAILAWLQTLPEFGIEAVLAWKQQTGLLLANLTGALRLLTGLAWPMIYATAALTHRKRTGEPLRKIHLDKHHSVEVVGLFFPLMYAIFIWWKGSLHVYDAVPLVCFYLIYLYLLTKLPPEKNERVDDLEVIPRSIVQAPKPWRLGDMGMFHGGRLDLFRGRTIPGQPGGIGDGNRFAQLPGYSMACAHYFGVPGTGFHVLFCAAEENAGVALMNITSAISTSGRCWWPCCRRFIQ